MGTECQVPRSEEDRRMIDEAIERGVIIPEAFREVTPEVERAIEERCIECLKESIEDGKREFLEMLSKSNSTDSETALTDIQKLDLGVDPTDDEYEAMIEVGEELGIVRNVEIIDMPVVTGIKGDETVQVIDKELQEMGYDKPVEKFIHLDTGTTKALARETLGFLVKSKIPEEWRDQATINMIVGVDRQQPGSEPGKIAVEQVSPPELLQAVPERSRNLYLFQNSEGRLVPRDPKDARNKEERGVFEKEKADFQWKIAHGIWHINEPRTSDVFKEQFVEWERARIAQFKIGEVTDYALEKEGEFRAEHFAAWVMDSPKLCPEMKEFFDKHFLK